MKKSNIEKEIVSVEIPSKLANFLKKVGEKDDRTLSYVLRKILISYAEKNGFNKVVKNG